MIFIAESKTAPSSHHLFFRGCCSWVLGDINKEEDLKLDSKVVNMGKEGKKDGVRSHIEKNHLVGISIPCEICGSTFDSRMGLYQHKNKNHK